MPHLLPRLEFFVQGLLRRQRRCPHCGSAEQTIEARKYGVIRIQRCKACGLCYTDPIYRSWLWDAFYDSAYDQGDLTTRLPDPSELDRLVRTRFAGTNKDFSATIAALDGLGVGKRWLEFGSSWGYFVFQARAAGLDAVGVEVGAPRRQYGVEKLGLPIAPSLAHYPDGAFDLVYTGHVLEHFTDLSTIFQDLRRMLRPGGVLVVEVPNFDREARGDVVLPIIGAVHPLGFDSAFFRRNLPRYGFGDVRIHERYDGLCGPGVDRSRGDVIIVRAEAR